MNEISCVYKVYTKVKATNLRGDIIVINVLIFLVERKQ